MKISKWLKEKRDEICSQHYMQGSVRQGFNACAEIVLIEIEMIRNVAKFTIENSIFYDYDDDKLKRIVEQNQGTPAGNAAKVQLMNRAILARANEILPKEES